MNVQVLGVAVLAAAVIKLLVDHLFRPVEENVPAADDWWWKPYVYLVIGGALGWFTELNGFPELWPRVPEIGRALTALLIGGGPELVRMIAEGINTVRLDYYEGTRALEYQLAKEWRAQSAQARAAPQYEDVGVELGVLMATLMRVLDPDRYNAIRRALIEYESGDDDSPADQ